MNLDNFIKECKEQPVSLALQKTVSLGNGSYKILCETSKSNFNNRDIKKAISNLFNNKVSVLEDTIQSKTENLVSMVVKANVRSIAYKDGEVPAGKKMITASIAADVNDNSIWEVQGTGDNKRLVLKADEDFEKIFQHNNRVCTASVANTKTAVESGDYISYYDAATNAIKSGFALVSNEGEIEVIDRELNEVPVDNEAVLDSTDLTELNKNPVEAALANNNISKIKDYAKQLFKDTEFFNRLDELLKVRSDLGVDGKYESTMVTAGYEENIDQIKEEIKDFLVNDSIEELRDEVLNTEVTPFEEPAEANAEGDIDIEDDLIIDNYPEIEEVPEVEAEGEEPMEAPVEEIPAEEEIDDSIEEITAEDETLEDNFDDLLDEDEITVTSELELDEGEFEDVEVKEPVKESLDESIEELAE